MSGPYSEKLIPKHVFYPNRSYIPPADPNAIGDGIFCPECPDCSQIGAGDDVVIAGGYVKQVSRLHYDQRASTGIYEFKPINLQPNMMKYNLTNNGYSVSLNSIAMQTSHAAGADVGKHNRGYIIGGTIDIKVGIDTIQVLSIASFDSTAIFGNLSARNRNNAYATSNGSNDRIIHLGGMKYDSDTGNYVQSTDISYFTSGTPYVVSVFGNLASTANTYTAVSNAENDRAVFNKENVELSFVTISNPANATIIGNNSTIPVYGQQATDGGVNDRGLFSGGYLQFISYRQGYHDQWYDKLIDIQNVISFMTISSGANTTSFGSMSTSRVWHTMNSNGEGNIAVSYGGDNYFNVTNGNTTYRTAITAMEKMFIDTPGSVTLYNTVNSPRYSASSVSNG